MDTNFEELPTDNLAQLLHQFYGTVLSKQGKKYSKSGMVNLRSGLNRYLQNPLFKRTLDLMNDKCFLQASKVLTGKLCDNKENGLDVSKPRHAIDKEDMEILFNKYFSGGLKKFDTYILMQKVFFDIVYYTGRRGKEGLCELTKNSFEIKTAANGNQYIEITFNEKTKKIKETIITLELTLYITTITSFHNWLVLIYVQ